MPVRQATHPDEPPEDFQRLSVLESVLMRTAHDISSEGR